MDARVFGILVGRASEILRCLCEVLLLKIGIAQSATGGGIVWIGFENRLKFVDGLIPIVRRVQMDIGQDCGGISGGQRACRIVFSEIWAGAGIA